MKEKKAALVIGDYENAEIKKLYYCSSDWLAEINFWREEIQFMLNLLEKHFLNFFKEEKLVAAINLINQVENNLQTKLDRIGRETQLHDIQLASFIKSPLWNEEKTYRAEHARLEQKIKDFEDALKLAKQNLFQLTKDFLKEEYN